MSMNRVLAFTSPVPASVAALPVAHSLPVSKKTQASASALTCKAKENYAASAKTSLKGLMMPVALATSALAGGQTRTRLGVKSMPPHPGHWQLELSIQLLALGFKSPVWK